MPQLNLVNTLILIGIYYVVGTLGMMMALPPGNVTPIYPAAGLAWALALIYDKKAYPIIFVGGMLSNLIPLFSIDKALVSIAVGGIIGLGEVVSVFIGCYLLKKFTSDKFQFSAPKEIITFSVIAMFWVISPSFGVTALLLGGFIEIKSYSFIWGTWWLGDSIGILLTTPLLFCCYLQIMSNQPIIANLRATTVTCVLAFIAAVIVFTQSFPIAYLLTLIALLSSFWLDQRSNLIVNIVIASVATFATLSGMGPFIEGEHTTNLLILQSFISVNIVVSQLFWSRLVQINKLDVNLQNAHFEARKDGLTNILNRRGFDERVNVYDSSLQKASIILFDIDDFKKINDTYGHDIGDGVLLHITKLVNSCIRSTDDFARIGGEEFSILMHNTSVEEAKRLAERICESVANLPANTSQGEIAVTISMGVTLIKHDEEIEQSIHRADELLYRAKANGKNQVVSL